MEIAATKNSITCGLRIADSWLGVKMKISWRFSKQRQLVTLLTIALAGTWQQVATQKKRFNEKCVVLESMGKPITSKRNCSNYLLGSGDLHGWHAIDSACGCSLSWFRISSHLRSLIGHWWQLNLHLLRVLFSQRVIRCSKLVFQTLCRLEIANTTAIFNSSAPFREGILSERCYIQSWVTIFWQKFHLANFNFCFSFWLVSHLAKFKIQHFYCDV